MNRREFLLSLLSVPFGWKALFRKEVKKEIVPSNSRYVVGEVSPTIVHLPDIKDTCEYGSGYPLPDWVADELKSGKTYREWAVDIPLDGVPDGWMRWAPIDAPSENMDKDPYAYEWSEPACCPPDLSVYSKWAARPMYLRCGDNKIMYCPDVSVSDPQWYSTNWWPARDDDFNIVWELIT